MRVDLFTMAYNEEKLLPHFVKHYKDRIANVNIHLYDNHSTDRTAELARELGCIVSTIDTEGEVRDDLLQNFKNNAWKESTAKWVIVCDVDEWVDIDQFYLELDGVSYFVCEGYDMIGGPDTKYGIRNQLYDKVCIFNRRMVDEINYAPGAHACFPIKIGEPANHRPHLYHMRYPSKQELVDRYKELDARLSQINKEKGWCYQYSEPIEKIEKHYDELDAKKTLVR